MTETFGFLVMWVEKEKAEKPTPSWHGLWSETGAWQ
jgi:hypothetical protein